MKSWLWPSPGVGALCCSVVAIAAWFNHDWFLAAIFTLMAGGYYKEWWRLRALRPSSHDTCKPHDQQ